MIQKISSKPELTFKKNIGFGRHGWVRLTPAYSFQLVDELLTHIEKGRVVFDPFSGSGTTPLAASFLGFESYSMDVNPFLVWLGNCKLDSYDVDEIEGAVALEEKFERGFSKSLCLPPIANIERWWDESALSYLSEVKDFILSNTKDASQSRNILLVAFCKTLIELSNAAYNHQSVSFKTKKADNQLTLFSEPIDYTGAFRNNFAQISSSCRKNPPKQGAVLLGDSVEASKYLKKKIDIIISSPPYPNRMSYIRELRPHMYWLDFLKSGKDAAILDWNTIGGTWGTATSNLKTWEPKFQYSCPSDLEPKLKTIESEKNGILMAQYVRKYFHDMWLVFQNSLSYLEKGAECHYVIGNSSFYGVLIDAEKIYCHMLSELGFSDVNFEKIRKRNSKSELYEFRVFAKR